jgi:hypothetical protein
MRILLINLLQVNTLNVVKILEGDTGDGVTNEEPGGKRGWVAKQLLSGYTDICNSKP